jgi:hypothetical protein
VEADGTLDRLEARRVDWRAKRDAGEVELTELMPLETDAERRWAYYVPQPLPDDAVEHAPASVRELKILDPAVGSGHFLVVAFELLVALYREEARHRGEAGEARWSERAIVEQILEHNLYGIDLDPRAVQIAAATLWLKAQQTCAEARPRKLNLVASNLRLSGLDDSDPALIELRREVERETGIPAALTDTIVGALEGADHLGSLLKIDAAVDEALRQHEAVLSKSAGASQGDLFGGFEPTQQRIPIAVEEAKETVLSRLERFLERHTAGEDLGLRLRGEQLAAGVRFVRMVREGGYDLVVGNPPYQTTNKVVGLHYLEEQYARGKADLFGAFLERALHLTRKGGHSALLTMRSWMLLALYGDLRRWLLGTFDLRVVGDIDRGAFEDVPDEVVAVAICIFRKLRPISDPAVAVQPTPLDDRTRDVKRTQRKRAAVLCGAGRCEFSTQALGEVTGWPLVYWWSKDLLDLFLRSRKLCQLGSVRLGMSTSNNSRYTRRPWEIKSVPLVRFDSPDPFPRRDLRKWAPTIMGAKGLRWFEPLRDVVSWRLDGLEMKVDQEVKYGSASRRIQSSDMYFRPGVAFTMLGRVFSARLHRFKSIFGDKGSSVFPAQLASAVTAMNRALATRVVEDLTATLSFTVGDVAQLPVFPVRGATAIVQSLDSSFTEHESHREASVEFMIPGPSAWRYAQMWADQSVDRPEGDPLPPYEPEYDSEPPTDHISFALGVALGRFGANGEGILDPATAGLSHALPAGTLFLDGSLDAHDHRDGLGHPATELLHDTWSSHGPSIDDKADLRTYLRLSFFEGVHRKMYESRPIHWPLSSTKKTFVAWINIHRFNADTLRLLLADHLNPALARLDGEIDDLREARAGADKQAARAAERRFASVKKWRDELVEFITNVEQCAEKGPPPTDAKCPPRDRDARYDPDLDDGVMINSAALWPLLTPQWKDPKKWYKELASAKDKKDYDWSHLAMRYWPERVDAKCQDDPSLGVAHGCFWKYHPARAWRWELRLQQEIGPDFRIDEAPYTSPDGSQDGGSDAHRAAYLAAEPDEALETVEKEALRRRKKQDKDDDGQLPPLRELTLLEGGLWTARPEACWSLEYRMIEKQEADFHLRAPDEPVARAAFETAHPEKVEARERLLAKLEAKRPKQASLAGVDGDGTGKGESGS